MGHYEKTLQFASRRPKCTETSNSIGMVSSIISPITNQNKTPLTSDQKQSRWKLLQENNSLSLEPPSKYDQHGTWSDTSPAN
jgi:hypothetical protein